MELIILAAIVLIWFIFAYEFLELNPKSKNTTLTADEVSSTQDEINRARSILKTIKSPESEEAEYSNKTQREKKSKEEILPDPFSEN